MGFEKMFVVKCNCSTSIRTAPESPTPSSKEELTVRSPLINTPGQNVTSEKAIFNQLKKWCWEFDISYESSEILRFAHFYNFDLEETKGALESNQDNHLLRLQMRGSLLKQFEGCALFPLRGLKTKRENSEVCYFRPSRFTPQNNNDPGALLAKNLCYVLNDLSTTDDQCRNGVAFLANMESYSAKMYEEHFWLDLLHVLQGNVIPTKVSLFLILNPPTWFDSIWKCLKTGMSPEFGKRVKIVDDEDLADYFGAGYQSYLPEDAGNGWSSTLEIVEDYIDRRIFVDKQNAKRKSAIHRASFDLPNLLKVL